MMAVLSVLLSGCGNGGTASDSSADRSHAPDVSSSAPDPVPQEPVTLVSEQNYDSWQKVPENALPDLHYWSGKVVGYADKPTPDGSTCQYFEYGCKNAANQAIFKEYLAALQENGFTLVDTYYASYKGGGTFESWGLNCDAAPNAQTVGLMYKDSSRCHVSIYNDEGIMRFTISPDLVVCDTGLRRGDTTADLRPQGPSIRAGLVRLPDGRYQTSDGRLTAAVGTAMVIRDGHPYTADADYTLGGSDKLNIEGYYRNESIFFRSKGSYLMEGDVFTERELRQWRQFSTEKADQDIYKYSTNADLSIANSDKWISPTYSSLSDAVYDCCSVRVMYMDKGGDAVFYIYARFLDGTPKEIEALCAVSTADDEGAFGNATYVKVGDKITLNYPHREYDSSYHVFDWSVVEGKDNVSIDSVGSTCTVTALKPGVAAVKLVYSYSVEEPDVLLGTPRRVARTKTESYYFVIE